MENKKEEAAKEGAGATPPATPDQDPDEKRQYRKFPRLNVVLFFDEANTTEEIGLIKQVCKTHCYDMVGWIIFVCK